MKFIFPFILSVLFIFCISNAGAQDSSYARQVIKELSSEKYHGRGYVKKGDRKAAHFIEEEFKNLQLLPLNGQRYFQDFSFPVNTFPRRMDVWLNNKKLIPGIDFIVHPGSPSCKGTFSVKKITKCPWNIPENDLKGKWLFVDTSVAENEITKKDYKNLPITPAGESGILFTEPVKLTWSVSREVHPVPFITLLKPNIIEEPSLLRVNIRSKYISNYETSNIAGMIEGTVFKDSFIFITAHYDHLGRMGKNVYFPGANDNASGIAMLLQLARHYSQEKNRLPYSLVFIAFAGEEAGLIGSKYFTEHPLLPLSKIRFLLNLDLLGTGDEGMMVVNATVHPETFQLLDSLNAAGNFLTSIGQRGKAANSDHYWFSEAGVPSFFCYTLGGIKAYHDVYDKAETLPLTKFKEIFRLFNAFLRAL